MSFDLDRLVAECRAARSHDDDAPQRIAAIVRDAIADSGAIAAAIEERKAARANSSMAEVLLNDDDLTIYQVAFPARLYGVAHDHAGSAVIGVYAGAEAFNVFEESDGGLQRFARREIRAGEVDVLAPDIIHDIENAGDDASASIHVYGNRHFDHPGRRIWRDSKAAPEPFTLQRSLDYGMERTSRKRRALGLDELAPPSLPEVNPGLST